MNNTIKITGNDFVVLRDPSIEKKFFLYDFDTEEYRVQRDGITPIAYFSRYLAVNLSEGSEIAVDYNHLPNHLKKILR